MKNKKIIRFVESLIMLPLATMGMPSGLLNPMDIMQVPQSVFIQKENIETSGFLAFNQVMDSKELTKKQAYADAIDAYYAKYNLPLEGMGMKMVEAAEEHGLPDWRLLPAIGMQESTGGKFACNYNPFGWASCEVEFNSFEEAIDTVAWNLGGNNPNTAQYYQGEDTEGILGVYNPPHIAPKYVPEVMNIMDDIGELELEVASTQTS